jgi:hypothetical protein
MKRTAMMWQVGFGLGYGFGSFISIVDFVFVFDFGFFYDFVFGFVFVFDFGFVYVFVFVFVSDVIFVSSCLWSCLGHILPVFFICLSLSSGGAFQRRRAQCDCEDTGWQGIGGGGGFWIGTYAQMHDHLSRNKEEKTQAREGQRQKKGNV